MKRDALFINLSRSVALVLAIGLGACASTPQTSRPLFDPNTWDLVRGIIAEGPVFVEIHGSPFATAADLEKAVTQAMEDAVTWSRDARFTSDAAAAPNKSVRVVMTFNVSGSGFAQCEGTLRTGPALGDGQVRVTASVCSGTSPLNTVLGRVGDAETVEDPAFGALIRQVTRELMPRAQDFQNSTIQVPID